MNISKQTIATCHKALIELKTSLINRSIRIKGEYQKQDHGKDDGDLTMAILAEKEFLTSQNRIRKQLQDIEFALAKIQNGTYGICEETFESISEQRLKTIPWTRLSLEGAEIREQHRNSRRKRNFA